MSQPDQKTLRAAAAPAPSERADGAGAAENQRKRRFSAQRKAAAVQRLIRGESLEAVSRDIGVPAHKLSEWRDRFLAGAENALKARESSPQDDEIARLKAIADKKALESALLRKKIKKLENGVPYHLQRPKK